MSPITVLVMVFAMYLFSVSTESNPPTFSLPICKYFLTRYDPTMKEAIDKKMKKLDDDCKIAVEGIRKEGMPLLDSYVQGGMFDEETQNKTCVEIKKIMDKYNNSMECIMKLSKSKK